MGHITQVIECVRAQLSRDILTRQIPRADEKGESLCPRVVGSFSLRLDVEVAKFHNPRKCHCDELLCGDEATPFSMGELLRHCVARNDRLILYFFLVIFRVVPSESWSGRTIGVEAMDSAWAASEGVVSGAGSRSSSTVSSIRI